MARPLSLGYRSYISRPRWNFERYRDVSTLRIRGKVRGMNTAPRLVVVMVFVLGAVGCIRRDGRNSDCRWPGEISNHTVSARHLSEDAEFAEELAISYADTHFGRHSNSEEKGSEQDQCMAKLFEEIAKEHDVPVRQVFSSLGRNRAYVDVAEILPFALLYGFAAVIIARMNWRR
jgi:hypothetical protein